MSQAKSLVDSAVFFKKFVTYPSIGDSFFSRANRRDEVEKKPRYRRALCQRDWYLDNRTDNLRRRRVSYRRITGPKLLGIKRIIQGFPDRSRKFARSSNVISISASTSRLVRRIRRIRKDSSFIHLRPVALDTSPKSLTDNERD